MTTYVALLRGINVGGKKKVPMTRLRELLAELGYTEVRTYLNSGNAVFTGAEADPAEVAGKLEKAIAGEFGFDVACFVIDGAYLRRIVESCPFPAADLEGRQLHVTFLSAEPSAEKFGEIDTASFTPEEFRLGEKAYYLYAPAGLGVSKLAVELARPKYVKGLTVTSRNWNTVKALLELSAG
ncbi:DUF1697 domain-containing protein [Phytomonospora endophytica]|uniref:Uncharacterized protein (DUF1697 family) n=1 Tax=Phytomonospora endophytica TaxID=714109 RepID=A0A841FPJ1_9ACTN|nr:DUF1697 domain-containing protein [Phytomonospora endophytica]MBB6038016.1 uncharacterized protein (DUF1697 family) [Phytomonospora endophytica]GIG68915.1 hypothetical protein Pen01_52100 [Phytomonospora endophytica]